MKVFLQFVPYAPRQCICPGRRPPRAFALPQA